MDRGLSPDKRAALIVQQMTLEEKLQMVHDIGRGSLCPARRYRRAIMVVPEKSPVSPGWVRRERTSAIDDLSVVDCDSAERSLRTIDRNGVLFIRKDLHICLRNSDAGSHTYLSPE
jgi:hypothetical protein